jgi:DNA-binding MarR family transcriptional regulator
MPTAKTWLTSDEQDLWRTYLAMTRRLSEALERQLHEDAGFSLGDYGILVHLSEAPGGRLRMSELACATVSSRSRLSHAARRLEATGWIRRLDCTDDGRGTYAEITPAGRAALEAAAPGHVAAVRSLFLGTLDDTSVAALRTVADRVLAALEGNPETGDPCG